MEPAAVGALQQVQSGHPVTVKDPQVQIERFEDILREFEREIKGFDNRAYPSDRPFLEKTFSQLKKFELDSLSPDLQKRVCKQMVNCLRLYANTFYMNWGPYCQMSSVALGLLYRISIDSNLSNSVFTQIFRFTSLEEWRKDCASDSPLGEALYETLLFDLRFDEHKQERDKILLESASQEGPEYQWIFASSLRWLFQGMQNHPEFSNNQTEDMTHRFELLFNLAQKMLFAINHSDFVDRAKKDNVELEYNCRHVLYFRRHPGDVEGCEKVYFAMFESLDKSDHFKSRVYNLMSCFWSKLNRVKAATYSMQAVDFAKKSNVSDFHKHNVLCNYAFSQIQAIGSQVVATVLPLLREGVKFADQQISMQRDHVNFTYWRFNYARALQMNGEKAEALRMYRIVIDECRTKHTELTNVLDAATGQIEIAQG